MAGIAFIDAHVHANNRSGEDFGRLAAVGCRGLVAVAGADAGFRGPDSVLDHFRRLAVLDRGRVERAGLRYFLALGVHPAGIPEKGVDDLLGKLPRALEEHRAVAVGEIGLNSGGDREERALAAQLEVAAEFGLPAIVHTPREDKRRMTGRILDLIAGSRLPPGRVLLDHLDRETLPQAADSGCLLGLSIHPAKLGPREAADVVFTTGPGALVLSTDMGANPSYLFGILAAMSAMVDRGVDEAGIRAVVHDNILRLLGAGP